MTSFKLWLVVRRFRLPQLLCCGGLCDVGAGRALKTKAGCSGCLKARGMGFLFFNTFGVTGIVLGGFLWTGAGLAGTDLPRGGIVAVGFLVTALLWRRLSSHLITSWFHFSTVAFIKARCRGS